MRLIVHHGGVDAESALAHGRKPQPAQRLFQDRGIFHARKDDALRTLILLVLDTGARIRGELTT